MDDDYKNLFDTTVHSNMSFCDWEDLKMNEPESMDIGDKMRQSRLCSNPQISSTMGSLDAYYEFNH